MKLQIIESISKHAVTLVLVIGILMLTDKGIDRKSTRLNSSHAT